MNYIELINRFWQEVEYKDFTTAEVCVYFRLLDVCNKLGWQNPFSLSNTKAFTLTGLSKNTFCTARDRLACRGLISVRSGKKRIKAPMYCFPTMVDDKVVFPWDDVLASKIDLKPDLNTDPKADLKTDLKPDLNAGPYNKTKTINKDSIESSSNPPTIQSLFAEEEKKEAKRKSKSSKAPQPEPPTLEEVKRYFLLQDADKRLDNWEESAQRFFDNFNAVGWRDKYNRIITCWDSRANQWILDDEKRKIENGSKEADRFSERRGTNPAAKSRKGFKGTF